MLNFVLGWVVLHILGNYIKDFRKLEHKMI